MDVAEPTRTLPRDRSQPRWWPAIGVVILSVGHQCWIWNVYQPDRTVQTLHSYLSLIPTFLSLGIWWYFFSKLSWKTRVWGTIIGIAACGLLACFLRIDDVSGEVFPILAWSWTPRREAISKAYVLELRERQRFQDENQPKSKSAPKQLESNQNREKSGRGDDQQETSLTTRDWPGFRGTDRSGVAADPSPIRTDWTTQPPVALWRHPVGPGSSSFAIVNGKAFTQEQRFSSDDKNAEAVVCYDVWTGQQIWEYQDPVRFTHPLGGNGPRATPAWYEGKLYTFGATGILNCLDASTGQRIWSHDVLHENAIPNVEYGMSGSPLVTGDVVVINPGGNDGKSVMAFHCLTGQLAWAQGNHGAAYASPQISVIDKVSQLVIFDAAGVAGHDLKSGQPLWTFPWTNGSGINGAQPIIWESNHVFASTSYGVGSVMFQVDHSDAGWTAKEMWQSKQIRLKFNSGVIRDSFLYGLDEGILTCFDLKEGRRKWKGGRFGFGQLLLIDDKLVVVAESGEVILIQADSERFAELGRFSAIEGKTWNYPAFWNGLLFVRNSNEAACYDLRAPSELP